MDEEHQEFHWQNFRTIHGMHICMQHNTGISSRTLKLYEEVDGREKNYDKVRLSAIAAMEEIYGMANSWDEFHEKVRAAVRNQTFYCETKDDEKILKAEELVANYPFEATLVRCELWYPGTLSNHINFFKFQDRVFHLFSQPLSFNLDGKYYEIDPIVSPHGPNVPLSETHMVIVETHLQKILESMIEEIAKEASGVPRISATLN